VQRIKESKQTIGDAEGIVPSLVHVELIVQDLCHLSQNTISRDTSSYTAAYQLLKAALLDKGTLVLGAMLQD